MKATTLIFTSAAILALSASGYASTMQADWRYSRLGNTVLVSAPSGEQRSVFYGVDGTLLVKKSDGKVRQGRWNLNQDQFCVTFDPATQMREKSQCGSTQADPETVVLSALDVADAIESGSMTNQSKTPSMPGVEMRQRSANRGTQDLNSVRKPAQPRRLGETWSLSLPNGAATAQILPGRRF